MKCIVFSKWSSPVGAAAIYKRRTHEDQSFDASAGRGACELQGAFRIDRAVKIDRAFLAWVMDTGGQMNHSLGAADGFRPIRKGTYRWNRDVIVCARQGAYRAADFPAFTEQDWRKMTADKAVRAGDKHNGARSIHCSGFFVNHVCQFGRITRPANP
jgi:hypothetical protein